MVLNDCPCALDPNTRLLQCLCLKYRRQCTNCFNDERERTYKMYQNVFGQINVSAPLPITQVDLIINIYLFYVWFNSRINTYSYTTCGQYTNNLVKCIGKNSNVLSTPLLSAPLPEKSNGLTVYGNGAEKKYSISIFFTQIMFPRVNYIKKS